MPSSESASSSLDPRLLTSLSEILAQLSTLQAEDSRVSDELISVLHDQESIIKSLSRLQSLLPGFDSLDVESHVLFEKVSCTASTADRIGGRVRSLDERMNRIREAADRVGQVMELKNSLAALQSSMQDRDWESAARHCARAMSAPHDLISGSFANTAVPSSDDPTPPVQFLQMAREHLLAIFRQSFSEASRARDSAATSRFFKLFPVIGWESEGLDVYASFVSELVQVRPPAAAKVSSSLYYVTTLTVLFESIAMIVDQHQPVVEKYYGNGKMKFVVRRLLQDCDKVVQRLVIEWEEHRAMKRKLDDITNCPPVVIGHYNNKRMQPSTLSEESVIDPREIDKDLTEIAAMVSRWSLLKKFIVESMKASYPNIDVEEICEHTQRPEEFDFTVTKTEQLFHRLLFSYYLPLEMWYTRASIDKAYRMSTFDTSQSSATSTTPDDVFYILRAVINRLLTTGSVDAVQWAVLRLRDVLEQDVLNAMKKRLDDIYKTNTMHHERENRTAFIIALNDLDIASSHLDHLIKDVRLGSSINQFFLEAQSGYVGTSFSDLADFSVRFSSAVKAGVEQLYNQLLRPKLRSFMTDVLRDVSYTLDDDEYSAAEYQDTVKKRFIKAWEINMNNYKDTCRDKIFTLLLGFVLDAILRPWEKLVIGLQFSELGAIRFDRDIRSVMTYLGTQARSGEVRSKFTRLQQISTLLNLDKEEDVEEFFNASGVNWRLSANEVKSIANLKV